MNETTRTAVPADTASHPQGFALLMALTAAEIRDKASPAQARGFYLAVGHRLAAIEPAGDAADLSVLGSRLNRLWSALDWGHVIFHMEDEGIVIRHQGLPPGLDGDMDGLWPELIAAVLEGAYDGWFRALGSGPALHTRRIDFNAGTLDLWHGR
ncbi:cellulose biosynthesis protein BcsD [Sphingobium estronivorans]|uniref:cellulose biosynthesis protein BcsD n=1 Tax=Sphingobium estronivorans TaxID=1577690 RepID=UPI00123B268B|nr:hypothetical protein [Sphingobium estronivorans]